MYFGRYTLTSQRNLVYPTSVFIMGVTGHTTSHPRKLLSPCRLRTPHPQICVQLYAHSLKYMCDFHYYRYHHYHGYHLYHYYYYYHGQHSQWLPHYDGGAGVTLISQVHTSVMKFILLTHKIKEY